MGNFCIYRPLRLSIRQCKDEKDYHNHQRCHFSDHHLDS